MQNNVYLIPANSKRSMLILGLFTPIDLIIFGVGVFITLLLLLIINAKDLRDVFFILLPVIVTGSMVMPVPNHRNVWQLTANIYNYFSNRRTYFWRGWCMLNGEDDNEK